MAGKHSSDWEAKSVDGTNKGEFYHPYSKVGIQVAA